jgi:glucose/arabinose dehydrogenase
MVVVITAFAPTPGAFDQDGPILITGRERLTWDQAGATLAEIGALEHIVYVDDDAAPVDAVRCDASPSADAFVCSSRLPAMAPGEHTIVVAARYRDTIDGTLARSRPLRVRVDGATSGGVNHGATHTRTADGIRLTLTVAATGLLSPTDIAPLPDGRLLLAERTGRIRLLNVGARDWANALNIDDCFTATGGGLLALAVDPQFESTHHVYALYTTHLGFRLARFVEAEGRLSSRAIIADDLPMSRTTPAGTVRIGSDRKIYLAIGKDDESSGDERASLGGKILRLNLDGTTPSDHSPSTPAIAKGLDRPTGMTVSADQTLWLSGIGVHTELMAIAGNRSERSTVSPKRVLPEHWGPIKLATYMSDAVPALKGDLLLGGRGSNSLVRVTVDHAATVRSAEWIFGNLGRIHAIAVAADGSIVIAAEDRLLRILVDR